MAGPGRAALSRSAPTPRTTRPPTVAVVQLGMSWQFRTCPASLSCITQVAPDQARIIISPDPVHRHGPGSTVGWLAQIASNQDRLATIPLREIGSFTPAAMEIGSYSETHASS